MLKKTLPYQLMMKSNDFGLKTLGSVVNNITFLVFWKEVADSG